MLKLLQPRYFSAVVHRCRNYCTNKLIREYEVPFNCNLNANIAFKTLLIPRDPLAAGTTPAGPDDPAKLTIKCEKDIQCSVVGDAVNISCHKHDRDENVTCEIIAPIKSNLNVMSYGDIQAKKFQGDAIRLCSEKGNILLEDNKTDELAVRTNIGDIVTIGSIEAAKITMKALKTGKIIANKLKCLGLHIETEDGNIETEACYSTQSYFVTNRGTLNLLNVHKHTKIVAKEGALKMVGFDGLLELSMDKGKADLQIAAIRDNSEIRIRDEGNLTLRFADDVLEHTIVDISGKSVNVVDNISFEESEDEDRVVIKPKGQRRNRLLIKCPNTFVTVKAENWSDVIKKAIARENN